MIDAPGRTRPLILVNPALSGPRLAFSFAHEIGHIVLPWHCGTISCHPGEDIESHNSYQQHEIEANCFASELLLPSERLREVFRAAHTDEAAMEAARQSGMSDQAITFSLVRALPPGHVLAAVSGAGRVHASGKTPGTAVVEIPRHGEVMDVDRYMRAFGPACSGVTRVPGRGSTKEIVVWRFPATIEPRHAHDSRTSGEIRDAILSATAPSEKERIGHQRQIAGIVGAANSSNRAVRSVEELLGALSQAFANRRDLAAFTKHSDFPAFLEKRAVELIARRT